MRTHPPYLPYPPLDTRRSLYGEPRLSDAQVRALRAAADKGIEHTRTVWSAGSFIVHDATVRFLLRYLLVLISPDGCHVTATQRGRSILAAIDATPATGGAA